MGLQQSTDAGNRMNTKLDELAEAVCGFFGVVNAAYFYRLPD